VYIDRAAYDAPGGKAPLLRQIGNLPPCTRRVCDRIGRLAPFAPLGAIALRELRSLPR